MRRNYVRYDAEAYRATYTWAYAGAFYRPPKDDQVYRLAIMVIVTDPDEMDKIKKEWTAGTNTKSGAVYFTVRAHSGLRHVQT